MLIAAIAVSAGLILGPTALAQEETPVDMKDLPSPAQTTIKEKAGSDQILRVAKETRKGKECYDAVVNRNGKEVAIRVDSTASSWALIRRRPSRRKRPRGTNQRESGRVFPAPQVGGLFPVAD
jgi:hypothetical protein